MTAVVPCPIYPITYSVGESDTVVTAEVAAPSAADAINALTESVSSQGFSINNITFGGSV